MMRKTAPRLEKEFSYRVADFEIARKVVTTEPLLAAWNLPTRPDPTNKEEFFDRS